eukprot:scaffold22881_cov104-Isochrysis_galbana.AAC.2
MVSGRRPLAHGDEASKAEGGGKRNLHLVFRGRWISARGPSHTPFGGVRNLANTYRRCGANCGPHHHTTHKKYSHPPPPLAAAARLLAQSARAAAAQAGVHLL